MCEVTILMLVQNDESHIKEAIDSVLKQSFLDFELLIIDYGSTDKTVQIIQSYTDLRVRLKNMAGGLVENLNRGLLLVQGEYIIRMSADDIMHSELLRILRKRMTKELKLTACSVWAKRFNDGGKSMRPAIGGSGLVEHAMLELLKGNMVAYSTVMIRKSFLLDNNLCYKDYPSLEDYGLLVDIVASGGTLFIEPQKLFFCRKVDKQMSALEIEGVKKHGYLLRKEILCYLLNTIKNNKILIDLYYNMEALEKNGKIMCEETFQMFYTILKRF